MSYPISPMTKLDAVNICLSSMGEPTVNTLDGAAIDAQMASDLVDETSRTVQSMGWHWNREKHTIAPNALSQISLPANILRVDTVDDSKTVDVVQRGLKLFDVENSSYEFTDPLKIEMYVQLSFEDLPYAAKQFITMRAARLLQQRLLGSDTLYKFHAADEQKAWIVLMQEETEVADGNMLYDSWDTQKIVSRGYFSRGGFG